MESEARLFTSLTENKTIKAIEQQIQDLLQQGDAAELDGNTIAAIGEKYFELAQLTNDKEKDPELSHQSLAYFAQAIKFFSTKAVKYFLGLTASKIPGDFIELSEEEQNKYRSKWKQEDRIFLNVFLLVFTQGPFALKTNDNKYADSRDFFHNTVIDRCSEGGRKGHFPLFLKEICSGSKSVALDEPRKKITEFISIFAEDFDNLEPTVQLLKFCSEKKFIDQPSLLAYIDFFLRLAKKYPEKYLALPTCLDITRFISNVLFDNNELDLDIKFIQYLETKQLTAPVNVDSDSKIEINMEDLYLKISFDIDKPIIPSEPLSSFNDLLYEKVLKSCQKGTFDIALLYYLEIPPIFKLRPNENLFELIRTVGTLGGLKNIQLSLNIAERMILTMTKEETSHLAPQSLNSNIVQFHRIRSQVDSQLSLVLEFGIAEIQNQIKNIIDAQSNLLAWQFYVKPFSLVKESLQTLKKFWVDNYIPLKLWEAGEEKKKLNPAIVVCIMAMKHLKELELLIDPCSATENLRNFVKDFSADLNIILQECNILGKSPSKERQSISTDTEEVEETSKNGKEEENDNLRNLLPILN